ncbi:MAG: hypothetical protein L3J39_01840 [Verrucomicrobiales bacterium]|nr:hypothetical protein [Verrucomicrobiales bacterium]
MIEPNISTKLTTFASALIDQQEARILIPAKDPSTGFWFGGGNTVQDRDGSILICGRYRNFGDSRTGTGAGARGLELAIFRADSPHGEFSKIVSFYKSDLTCNGREVVSIEGCALHLTEDGIELFISTEKDDSYPESHKDFQKPGTGVWSIDRIHASKVEDLSPSNIEEIVPFGLPPYLHVKDPVTTDLPDGSLALIYCTHPFSWSSSGTSVIRRAPGTSEYQHLTDTMLARGPVWDIAAARVTDRLPIPKVGAFADQPDQSLYFYDSAECLRQLDDNPEAVARPRGWSCEEIGGLAFGVDADFPRIDSITIEEPLFISPTGTGCSRYISTLVTDEGIFATWQQSQKDLSQPLVGHFLSNEKIAQLLA